MDSFMPATGPSSAGSWYAPLTDNVYAGSMQRLAYRVASPVLSNDDIDLLPAVLLSYGGVLLAISMTSAVIMGFLFLWALRVQPYAMVLLACLLQVAAPLVASCLAFQAGAHQQHRQATCKQLCLMSAHYCMVFRVRTRHRVCGQWELGGRHRECSMLHALRPCIIGMRAEDEAAAGGMTSPLARRLQLPQSKGAIVLVGFANLTAGGLFAARACAGNSGMGLVLVAVASAVAVSFFLFQESLQLVGGVAQPYSTLPCHHWQSHARRARATTCAHDDDDGSRREPLSLWRPHC